MFSIGITGYLDQFANMEDLQLFYADQRPDALNSSFKVVSVNGDTEISVSVATVLTVLGISQAARTTRP